MSRVNSTHFGGKKKPVRPHQPLYSTSKSPCKAFFSIWGVQIFFPEATYRKKTLTRGELCHFTSSVKVSKISQM